MGAFPAQSQEAVSLCFFTLKITFPSYGLSTEATFSQTQAGETLLFFNSNIIFCINFLAG
jgi:hypothetical protein